MSSDIDLEARLRSHLAAERQVYQPPAALTSRIRQAIRSGSIPARRPAMLLQLAAAAGISVLVAILSVGLTWMRHGGLASPSAATYRIATSPKGGIYLLAGASGVLRGQGNADGTGCLWGVRGV